MTTKRYKTWRESKRKRPEPELPDIERLGQARAKARVKPAPWFVVKHPQTPVECKTREEAEKFAASMVRQSVPVYVCRAVASFTAKVEREDYQ